MEIINGNYIPHDRIVSDICFSNSITQLKNFLHTLHMNDNHTFDTLISESIVDIEFHRLN